MKYWTEDEKQRIRYGIMELAKSEFKNKSLNQWQLQLVISILGFKKPVEYTEGNWIVRSENL